MTNRAMIRRIERADGEGYIEFVRGDDGQYRFVEYARACDPGYEPFFWQRSVSGLYDNLESAERDANATFPWLSDAS